jgi:hypothetical protein
MSKADSTVHKAAYTSDQIVVQLEKGNKQEAASELARDLHSSKNFNAIYANVQTKWADYEKTHGKNAKVDQMMSDFGLVDKSGNEIKNQQDINHSKVAGIRVGDDHNSTTYTSDHHWSRTIDLGGGHSLKVNDKGETKIVDSHGHAVSARKHKEAGNNVVVDGNMEYIFDRNYQRVLRAVKINENQPGGQQLATKS